MAKRPTQALMARRVRIAQVLLILIVVVGSVQVAGTVTGANIFRDPDRVTIHLPQAAGLHDRSTVNYRGQRVGKVQRVALSEDGVRAVIELDAGTEVPRDSEFVVANLSAVGEQYLDIRPRTAKPPYLGDGDEISADETSVPLPMHRVLAHAHGLLDRIDVRDIERITTETEALFADDRVDLRATMNEAEELFATLQVLQPQLSDLLRDAEKPLRTGVDLGSTVRALADDAALIGAELRRLDPALRSLLDRADAALPVVRDLWAESSPLVADLARTAAPLVGIAAARLPGLHHWLDWVPAMAEAMAGSTRNSTGQVLLVPKVLDNCIYTDEQRAPTDITRRPVPLDDHCTDDNPILQQRGARNAPRP